jgi:Uma2 family endonuclease
MAEAAHTESLYDAIERLPEGVVGEIIDGQLHTQPRPAGPHVRTAGALYAEITGPFDRGRNGPGGWQILPEPEIHFRRDVEVLVPDIAGWRRERLPEMPEDQRFEVVPDWVCEVLSPSTAGTDRELKMRVYARYGVPDAWLVDPREKRVEAYTLETGAWHHVATASGDTPIRAAPFTAIDIPPPWA